VEEIRGEILERFRQKNLPLIRLTAHAFAPEALKQSFEMVDSLYLPTSHLAP
jgi:hypothetical protein